MKNKEILDKFYELLGKYYNFNKSFEKDLYEIKVLIEEEICPSIVQDNGFMSVADKGKELLDMIFNMSEMSCDCSKCNCLCQEDDEEIEEVEILDVDEMDEFTSFNEIEFGEDYVDISVKENGSEVSFIITGLSNTEATELKRLIDMAYGNALRAVSNQLK